MLGRAHAWSAWQEERGSLGRHRIGEHAVPRAWWACVVACVRLGQGRPQGEISNVTLVLGRMKMGAAEQEGKEDCGD